MHTARTVCALSSFVHHINIWTWSPSTWMGPSNDRFRTAFHSTLSICMSSRKTKNIQLKRLYWIYRRAQHLNAKTIFKADRVLGAFGRVSHIRWRFFKLVVFLRWLVTIWMGTWLYVEHAFAHLLLCMYLCTVHACIVYDDSQHPWKWIFHIENSNAFMWNVFGIRSWIAKQNTF